MALTFRKISENIGSWERNHYNNITSLVSAMCDDVIKLCQSISGSGGRMLTKLLICNCRHHVEHPDVPLQKSQNVFYDCMYRIGWYRLISVDTVIRN